MLTGPIFSQEDEDEMMNLSEFRDRPRVEESQEHSRGTVILEGEDEEGDHGAIGEVFVTPSNVIPPDYNREEYAFSLDFSAPTHVYSLQFNPPEDDQKLHDDSDEDNDGGSLSILQRFWKKNQLFCLVAGVVFVCFCGIQQLVIVKNDLVALRVENQQLRLTIETLQQDLGAQSAAQDHLFYKMFERGFPVETNFGDCAAEAKNQLYHHLTDLKDSFWTTAERVRDIIEDELLGPAPHEPEQPTATNGDQNIIDKWLDKDALKDRFGKTIKQIGSAKVLLPVLFVSGASLAVDWLWNKED